MSENLENLENLENSKVEVPVEPVETEDTVTFVSAEEFQEAGQPGQQPTKKVKKPLSKKAKIAIIAGVTVAVVLLTTIITLVVIFFQPSGPSGAVDNSVIAIDASDVNVGINGSVDDGNPVIILDNVFSGKSSFSCDATKGVIEDKTIDGVSKKVMTVLATSGSFDLKFKGEDGKEQTVKINVNEGVNVYTVQEFDAAIKAGESIINIQADIITVEEKGYVLKSVTINGNGNQFDGTKVTARTYNDKGKPLYTGSTLFDISKEGTGVTVRDLHIVGEKVVLEEGKEFSLDEFESNGAIFVVYGDDQNENLRAKLNIEHCIIENGHKHVFARSSDVTIKNSILRNGSDAIIAVETNVGKGAVLTVENNIISNSVVAGILFCGWTNVGTNKNVICTLDVKGFLDIYNWKDTSTAKLVPGSEGAVADLVNNMVKKQIKTLTKDKKAVKEYMYKDGSEYFVHIGIILLATGSFKANETKVVGMDIETGKDSIGYVKRGFPIPKFAKAIAKTCELIGYNQETASKEKTVRPKKGYGSSEHFLSLGFSIIETAK